jgi:arylsulfatase A-like enzyme
MKFPSRILKVSVSALSLFLLGLVSSPAAGQDRPNILWITSEDNGPHLGCYGDTYATTPNLDGLAARGMIYLNAWSTAPVCAPARTTIISGVYPPSTGSEHMRSLVALPSFMKMFPQFLREAGYYCSNNSKEDYNLKKPGKVWDESSKKAHWKNRRPGQPFFAVFNHTVSHESQIRKRPHTLVHDPARVRVPAYHPDTPEVRHDWAQYYDKITEMDVQVGRDLRELEAAGLADSTIIFYYGDHGSGMPRSKRFPYDSGLHVPLLVYVPPKFRPLAPPDYAAGGKSDRLVGFIDLAPTVLSLAGIQPPDWMQGHAFMGKYQTPPQPYLYGFRGRMDERYDLIRSIRDKRYIYLRNYMPHKIYGQYVAYMFETPTTQVWKKLYDQGKLHPPQTYFWEPKPPEELYDLEQDPDEVRNLASSAEHQQILERLRHAQQTWTRQIRDVGFLPETEIHARSQGSSPYEMGHNNQKYPLEKIIATAELASSLEPEALNPLRRALRDEDSAVRYWAALGLLMRARTGTQAARTDLRQALKDSSASVRIVAAEALAKYGDAVDLDPALDVLLETADAGRNPQYTAMLALNVIDDLDAKAASRIDQIKALPRKPAVTHARSGDYVERLLDKILSDLEK